jgi:hypothetical protein
VLICVAGGEPGKEDVLFAGRLIRHLGAEVSLLSVFACRQHAGGTRQADPFLGAGTRTPALGVHAQAKAGVPRAEILQNRPPATTNCWSSARRCRIAAGASCSLVWPGSY